MSDLLFDTCFLIDLEREMRRGRKSAHAFLARHLAERPCVSWTVAGEFAEGFGDIGDSACAGMLARFDILEMNESTAGTYARITRQLRQRRQLIGTNDLWIAAAAIAHGATLVTNNTAHFGRVPGLRHTSY